MMNSTRTRTAIPLVLLLATVLSGCGGTSNSPEATADPAYCEAVDELGGVEIAARFDASEPDSIEQTVAELQTLAESNSDDTTAEELEELAAQLGAYGEALGGALSESDDADAGEAVLTAQADAEFDAQTLAAWQERATALGDQAVAACDDED
jgi:hypothetical protein